MRFGSGFRHLLLTLALAAIALVPGSYAQDQPSTPAQDTGGAPAVDRDVSWRQLPGNILQDQKSIWTFPVQVAHGKHLVPVFTVTGITAALLVADPHEVSLLRKGSELQGFNTAFSSRNTNLGIIIFPTSFYAVSLLRKNQYDQKTALLAGEALLNSEILVEVMKVSSQRLRPYTLPPQGDFDDTFFKGHTAISSSSFPSGHTIAAFSLATIFARRYGNHHRWVPWVAYGLAGVVGFSRLSLQEHFPSDVFLGAALGYSVSRFAVLHQ
jgi:membrane-associated phospholipid phosphatase